MKPPRYNEPLSLWIVRSERGARGFPSLTQAEHAAEEGDQIYRGPRTLGALLEAGRLEEVPR